MAQKKPTAKARERGYVKGSYAVDARGNRVSANAPGATPVGGARPPAPAPAPRSVGGVQGAGTMRPDGAPAPVSPAKPTVSSFSPYSIQPGDTLGGIAQRYGTSVQSLMAQNPSISNPNRIRAGASLNVPSMGRPPSAPSTPSASAMSAANPYALPGTPTPTLSAGLIADVGASTTADAAAAETPAPVSPQQQTLDYIQQLTQQQTTKGDRTAEIQAQEKLDVKQKALADIDKKIKERTRALELKRRAIIESPYAGTKTGQQRDLDTLERQSAQELADLAIAKSVALEDYTTAYDIAQRKIDAEFEPLQQQIDNAIKFYQLNQDNLSEREKLDLQLAVSEKQAAAEDIKSAKRDAYKVAIDNGASSAVLAAIGKAQTADEAYAAVQGVVKQDQMLDVWGNPVAPGGDGTPGAAEFAATSGLDPQLVAYANQYAATGQIPTGLPKGTFGQVAQVAKELPKPNGAVVDRNTGVASTKVTAAESDDYARLYNILQMTERLKALDDERWGGVVAGTLGKVFGSEKQAEYLAVRKAIVDEIQRMQSGAALTEEEQEFYKDYLPGRFSESFFLGVDSAKKIENFDSIMRQKLTNGLANRGLSIYGYSEVDVLGKKYKVGDTITAPDGSKARVLPDGSLSVPEGAQSQQQSNAGNASADAIAKAILSAESGGDYGARGASGESGGYQFMPATWKGWAGDYLGDPNAPMTKANQDAVARAKISDWLAQGYNPEQIALLWNGGEPRRKKGVNQHGVPYDSGAYADRVLSRLNTA